MEDTILILDFGSQYTQLIARKIRELNVYCEIHPFNKPPVTGSHIKGVILSGSPFSVRDPNAPKPDLLSYKGVVPILGICYGAQYLSHFFGGEVLPSNQREYGRANLSFVDQSDPLFGGISRNTQVWMSHGDTIAKIPDNYRITASTNDVMVGGFHIKGEPTFGIQFHPEVYHTLEGKDLLRNFLVDICGCNQSWTPDIFIESTIKSIRGIVGNDPVVLGLSGGVDSTVAGVLLQKAIGNHLKGIFIDNGLLRKNEFETVMESYKHLGINVIGIRAADEFLSQLKGVTDPEKSVKQSGAYLLRYLSGKLQNSKISGGLHKVQSILM